MTTIHVAIIRRVRPGCEAMFEQEILSFFAATAQHPGRLGAQLIRPLPGSSQNSYGILRSFASAADRDAFYRSQAFKMWEQRVEPLVEPEYSRRSLHGLEAFFANPALAVHPPKWKLALVTWIGVWPTVLFFSSLLGPHLQGLSPLFSSAIVTFFVVVALSWGVMPVLTKLFHSWLRPVKAEDLTTRSEP